MTTATTTITIIHPTSIATASVSTTLSVVAVMVSSVRTSFRIQGSTNSITQLVPLE